MRSLFLLLGVAFVAADSAAGAEPLAPKQAAAPRKVYVAKCAKCHKFYEPRSYGEADWGRWMEKMGRKSKLSAEQAALLQRYLSEYRAGRIAKAR